MSKGYARARKLDFTSSKETNVKVTTSFKWMVYYGCILLSTVLPIVVLLILASHDNYGFQTVWFEGSNYEYSDGSPQKQVSDPREENINIYSELIFESRPEDSIDCSIAGAADCIERKYEAERSCIIPDGGGLVDLDENKTTVILSSHGRSGATIAALLLFGTHNDVFYTDEPLRFSTKLNSKFQVVEKQGIELADAADAVLKCELPNDEEQLEEYFEWQIKRFITEHGNEIVPDWFVSREAYEENCRSARITAMRTIRLHSGTYLHKDCNEAGVSLIHYLLERKPKLKVLHLVRNPVEIFASCNQFKFNDYRECPKTADGYDKACKGILLDYMKGMDINRAEETERYKLIRYQDLITNTFETVRDAQEWMGLDVDEERLNYTIAQHILPPSVTDVEEDVAENSTEAVEREEIVNKLWVDNVFGTTKEKRVCYYYADQDMENYLSGSIVRFLASQSQRSAISQSTTVIPDSCDQTVEVLDLKYCREL